MKKKGKWKLEFNSFTTIVENNMSTYVNGTLYKLLVLSCVGSIVYVESVRVRGSRKITIVLVIFTVG